MNPTEREIALSALISVSKGGYGNIVIKKTLDQAPSLRREGRAFVTECVNGVLRRLLTLDYIINQVSKVNTRAMDGFILNLLRMAVYEMGFMETGAYAVVDEAVKIAAGSKFAALKGFVNANLRAAARRLPEIMAGIEGIRGKDLYAYLEVKHSVGRHVLGVLEREMGLVETERLLEHINTVRPMVTVRVNTLKTDADSLGQELGKTAAVSPALFMADALRLSGTGDMQAMPAYRNGLFHVMDEGAQLCVKSMGLPPGARVLDICAAPGGKAFMAAMEMGDEGLVDARDIHPHKANLLAEGASRLGLRSVSVKTADAAVFDESSACAFDAVLADVPCSGLGLIGKKADIRYRFSMKEVSKLQGLQRRILNNCAKYARPGGVVLYATCTLTAEENEKNAAWFAKTHGFLPEEMPFVPDGAEIDKLGNMRLLPHKTGTDGFYIAKFRRKK